MDPERFLAELCRERAAKPAGDRHRHHSPRSPRVVLVRRTPPDARQGPPEIESIVSSVHLRGWRPPAGADTPGPGSVTASWPSRGHGPPPGGYVPSWRFGRTPPSPATQLRLRRSPQRPLPLGAFVRCPDRGWRRGARLAPHERAAPGCCSASLRATCRPPELIGYPAPPVNRPSTSSGGRQCSSVSSPGFSSAPTPNRPMGTAKASTP